MYCLLRLNLCIIETASFADIRGGRKLFRWKDDDRIKNLLSKEPLASHPFDSYNGHESQEVKIREFVDGLTKDQVDHYIRDLSVLHYLPRMFEQRVNIYQMTEARKRSVEASPDFTVASDQKSLHGQDYSKSEYAEQCVINYREARIDLRLLYNIAMELRDYIPQAVSQGLLDETSLEQLKSKMSAIQEHFHETCHELGKPMQDLVSETEPWW